MDERPFFERLADVQASVVEANAQREEELHDLGLRLADEVQTAVIRPGDTLVVGMPRRITDQEYDEMASRMKYYIPGVRLLLFPETGWVRVFRPDGEGM